MKRQLIVGATVLGVFVVAGMLAVRFVGWWTLPLGVVVVAGAWLGGRCWHRDVSLLPPVHGAGSDREFARWHCNGCGATWATNFEPSTRPRTIYAGYDQAKAQQAAARADTLERERRRLAIERSGLTKSRQGPVAVQTAGSSGLPRVAAGGRIRRLSVDSAPRAVRPGLERH